MGVSLALLRVPDGCGRGRHGASERDGAGAGIGRPRPTRRRSIVPPKPAGAQTLAHGLRAADDQAGPEPDLGRPPEAAAGRGRLDRRLPPRARARQRRQAAPGRPDPPAPRGLARRLDADVRLGRGEDVGHRAARLRLALHDQAALAAEPHDPQPDADPGDGLPDGRDRLHPGHGAGGQGRHRDHDALDGRPGADAVSGLQRRAAREARAAATRIRTTIRRAYKNAPRIRQPLGRRP